MYLSQLCHVENKVVPMSELRITKGCLVDKDGAKIDVLYRQTYPIEDLIEDQDPETGDCERRSQNHNYEFALYKEQRKYYASENAHQTYKSVTADISKVYRTASRILGNRKGIEKLSYVFGSF